MANKIYRALETPLTWKDSGGDAVITLQNLAAGAGRVGAQYDRGAGSKPERGQVRAVIQFETAPVVGETVEIWLFQSDGTYQDGVVGTSDAALTSDKRRNGTYVGSVIVDTTATATNIIRSFETTLIDRYFSPGVWNGSAGDNLENTANACAIIITPIAAEIQ